VEWAEPLPRGIRVPIAIADVHALVDRATPIDLRAQHETTTVYTGVRTYPMLPERLSTDLTSLNEDQVREGIVIEMLVQSDGSLADTRVYRAQVRNRAQLTYGSVGPWLEGAAPPPAKVAASPEL